MFAPLLNPELPEPEFNKQQGLRRYSLKTALIALREIVGQIQFHNTALEYPWLVDELLLFGSVHRAAPKVGDLDLYVSAELRSGWSGRQALDWCRHKYPAWYFKTGTGRYSWEYHLLKDLRAGRKVVSFCKHSPRILGWPHVSVPLIPGMDWS